MKIDSKRRSIQQKYREKIELKNQKRKHTIEALVVIFSIVLLFLLNGIYGNVFKSFYPSMPKVQKISESEAKWMWVVSEIDKKLKINHNQYTSMTIDFNPKSRKYILETSMLESNLDVDENLNELINVANEIITSNNLPNLLQEDETYEIIVRGKNKEQLTSKVFH